MIDTKEVQLEANYHLGNKDASIIICHPHPLYGGDMHNGAVVAMQKLAEDLGLTTIRFNFRGTGKSTGNNGNGKEEAKDIQGVIDYIKNSDLPSENILLAGYSFGAGVISHYLTLGEADACIFAAPPLTMFDFSPVKQYLRPKLIMIGERDEITPISAIKKWYADLQGEKELHIFPNVNHFAFGYGEEIDDPFQSFIQNILS